MYTQNCTDKLPISACIIFRIQNIKHRRQKEDINLKINDTQTIQIQECLHDRSWIGDSAWLTLNNSGMLNLTSKMVSKKIE